RPSPGIQGEVVAGPPVAPARRHNPGVLALEVSSLRSGRGGLVPRVALIHWIAERVDLDERLTLLPVVIEGTAQQDADAEINVHKASSDQGTVHDPTGGDVHQPAPPGAPLAREGA